MMMSNVECQTKEQKVFCIHSRKGTEKAKKETHTPNDRFKGEYRLFQHMVQYGGSVMKRGTFSDFVV